MNDLTDNQLIEKYLADDDEQYLTQLFERYLKPIYNFVRHYGGESKAADDLSQEVFIKVWKNLRKFDQNRNFKVWLFQIARNTCIDHLRKRKDLLFSELEYPTDEEQTSFGERLPDTDILPDEEADRKLLAGRLDEILDQLPPDTKALIWLRHREDLSFREIAEMTGSSLDTVKSRYRRALLSLRKILKKDQF